MGLPCLAFYFQVVKGCMLFAVTAQLVRARIRMVMALQYDINLIGIINRRDLRPEQNTVRIGMIQTAAVNILMHDDNTPFGIRMGFDRFFN